MLKRIGRRTWSVVAATWSGWRKDDGALLSAATAYYAAFSLFPLCLVLMAGLGFVGRHSTFLQTQQRDLLRRVEQNVSPWLAGEMQGVLAGVEAKAVVGGPLGMLFLILAAIGIFTQLQNIFDRIWAAGDGPDYRVEKNAAAQSDASAAKMGLSPSRRVVWGWWAAVRAALWDRLLAFLMLLAIGALLIAVFLTDMILAGLRPYLAQLPAGRPTWHVLQSLSAIGCNALLLAVVYRVLPTARVRWAAALGGGLLAAVVWAIGQTVLLALLIGRQYGVYGILGALMGIMLWFYYASAVVFLGAEFVHVLGSRKSSLE